MVGQLQNVEGSTSFLTHRAGDRAAIIQVLTRQPVIERKLIELKHTSETRYQQVKADLESHVAPFRQIQDRFNAA
jgi:hypothetical protein